MGNTGKDLSGYHALQSARYGFYYLHRLNLQSDIGKYASRLFGGHVQRQIIFQPVIRNFHMYLSFKKRSYKSFFIKYLQIVNTFTQTNEFDRDL